MNDLVINHNGTPATTQNTVSELTDNNEQSVQRLIRAYEADLKEFGELEFKNELICNSKNKINYKKVYCLNEQQATLLLTYMKNTAKVREAKKILVKAFYDMRQKLQECQINGYKSQISKHNALIVSLKNELIALKESKPKTNEELERELRRIKREFEGLGKDWNELTCEYLDERSKNKKLEAELKKLTEKIDKKEVRVGAELVKIQNALSAVHQAVGAVASYAAYDDEYFLLNLKG